MTDETQNDITTLTVQLLSAYVSRNTVPSENLADLIKTTRAALTGDLVAEAAEPVAETFTGAVSVRKSLASPDHILSLIDGKPYKTLKRHLATHGLTPEQYRERYKLPKNYPLVAQSYSQARRAVAEKLGLGKKPAVAASAGQLADTKSVPADVPVPKAAAAPKATKKNTSDRGKKSKKAETAAVAKAPVAGVDSANIATEPATAPRKTPKSKVEATPKAVAIISNRANRADIIPAATKKTPRKRLSISAPKEENPESKLDTAPETVSVAAKSETSKAVAAPKAKPGRKPRSLKAAPEAANAPDAATPKA